MIKMATISKYCVECDECGDTGPLAENKIWARERAKFAGWKIGHMHHLCPRCRQCNTNPSSGARG